MSVSRYSGNLQRVAGNRVKGAMYMKEIMLKRLKPLIIQLIVFGIIISIPPPSAGGTNSNESVSTLYVML